MPHATSLARTHGLAVGFISFMICALNAKHAASKQRKAVMASDRRHRSANWQEAHCSCSLHDSHVSANESYSNRVGACWCNSNPRAMHGRGKSPTSSRVQSADIGTQHLSGHGAVSAQNLTGRSDSRQQSSGGQTQLGKILTTESTMQQIGLVVLCRGPLNTQ